MNYIKQVADILDVELEEDFYIQACGKVFCYNGVPIKFWFNENGLQTNKIREDDDWVNLETAIGRLISGTWSIKKIPWRPKCGEIYWIVRVGGSISYYYNNESTQDIAFMALGNCFATEEKAEKNKEEMINKMKAILNGR